MLRDIESKLAGLVEGTFGRMFRSEVTPAELARGLAREMEATRRQGLDRTWVAHHYDVFLSPADHRRIADGATPLAEELAASLVVHAREQRFALAHAPHVAFHLEPDLPTSRYGVKATHDDGPSERAAEPDRVRGRDEGRRREVAAPSAAAPVRRREPVAEPPSPRGRPREAARRAGGLVLVLDGRREAVPVGGGTVGRSRDCDVVIASAEVSRRHMELRPHGDGWVVRDLGSTNGVLLNGEPVGGPDGPGSPVRPGDRLALGTVTIAVEDGP